ncbi:MAG: trypsin-like peptidase domain-containing protein, partial [Propionibacteriaceae bacterium]|nr:trypsin-like peptidase domain-containing protein [Propionibacteriaceae bacterium]
GQPPTAAPGWVAQQSPWPVAHPQTPSGYGASGAPSPYSAAGAAYGPPGYPQQGYPPPGYAHPGYTPPGQYQYPQSPYGSPYARYANPSQAGYVQPPHNPYAQHYPPERQPGQQWPAPAAPRRRTGRTILVVALALAMAITGFAWALRPMLEQSLSPTVPSAEPVQPNQPTTQPGTDPDPDPNPRPGATGGASESAGVVFVEGESSGGIAAGTGMVLTPDGKVLTNYHVVAGTQWLEVTIADSGDTYTATVLGFDQSKDVALLQLEDASGLATVTIDKDEVKVGDPVAAVGNAGGNNELVRAAGEVVRLDRSLTVNSDSPWGSQEDLSGVIETTAGAVPGHSGGPMFDDEAEVLGITTAGSSQAGRSYAVPIADALEVVDIIEAGKDVGTVRVGPAGYMGIVIGNASRYGVTITDVVSGSPADQAGIEVGSTLVKVGDTRVSETTNLATVIRALEPGDEVTVEWLTPRGGERSASVTLTASPVN